MGEFFNGLKEMVIHFKVNPEYEYAILVFAVGCAFFGAVAVILDLLVYKLRGESLLELKYNETNTVILFIFWTFGALIMGYFGQLLWVFNTSMVACLVVGFSWPILATKMLEQLKNRDISKEPEQKI